MRKFVNGIGCSMSFENGINDNVIKDRLAIMGGNWEEVKE